MKTMVSVLTIVSFLVLAPLALADADPAARLTARAFHLRFKDTERAATAIKGVLSSEGSISIQPSSNTIIVTDRSENLQKVALILGQFDAPPQSFTIDLQLIAASRSESPKVPDELRGLAGKLSGALKFNSFEKMGAITAGGKEGDPVIIEKLSETFRAEFKFGEYDPASDTIQVKEFQLSRLQPNSSGSEVVSLLRTSLNLKVGQTVILGASRLPDSNRALMLVLVAKRQR